MARTQGERLKSLDNFQRAEFLRMQRTQIAYSAKIAHLRTQTAALYQKQQSREFQRLELVSLIFTVFAVITFLSLLVFDFTFASKLIGIFVLLLTVPGVLTVSTKILIKQDQILYESYALEIMRYEAELEVMGLSDFYSQEEERTRDILSSLGFDNGLIGGTLDMRPLEARE